MSSLREDLERKLKEKLSEVADVPGSGKVIIASTDGLPIASTLPETENRYVEEMSAYSTQIVKQVKTILHDLGLTDPQFIQIKTADGVVLNMYIKGNKIAIYIED